MGKINEDIIIDINELVDISSKTLGSEVNNIQLLAIKKKTSKYKKIYLYSVDYIQNNNNENVIDIEEVITIYNYYKDLYKSYKNYSNKSFLL